MATDRIYTVRVTVNALTDKQAEDLGDRLWDTVHTFSTEHDVDWVGSSHVSYEEVTE